MIQITAYLRTEEDHKLWKTLPNKTEFLHFALNELNSDPPKETPTPQKIKPIYDNEVIIKPIVQEAKKNFNFCKHGSIKGLCKLGCK